jgi:DNA-binding GntR family transcriptional regulator
MVVPAHEPATDGSGFAHEGTGMAKKSKRGRGRGGRERALAESRRSGSSAQRVGRPKGTGTQRVYAQVREDIIGLRLPPGADLDEAGLEVRFGVSRTPVREALIRLASEGLVVLLPNRGARITQIDITDIPQLFEALELCQRVTLRWAAIRRSPEDLSELRQINELFGAAAHRGDNERMGESNKDFHSLIGRVAGNRYVESLCNSLLAASLRLARTVFAYAPQSGASASDYYSEIVRQHEAMIEAIESRDADLADKLARVHTDLFRDRIMRYVGKSLGGSVDLGSVTRSA